jgi:hypothetical protein
MESVQLPSFLDFVLNAGTGRVSLIKQLKAGHDARAVDFYKPVREAIVDMHERGVGTDALDALVVSLADPRERRIFPKVVHGYKKFLRQGKMTWFEPPYRAYPLGPLTVGVNPEVGLLIDGRPHVIKLYFRGDPITPQRVMLTNALLFGAMSATWPGTVWAVLDVRRAKLYPHRPKPELAALLRAEAACFSSLWGAL